MNRQNLRQGYLIFGEGIDFTPILDTLSEWVPRVLMSDRIAGKYLQTMIYGFDSDEKIKG